MKLTINQRKLIKTMRNDNLNLYLIKHLFPHKLDSCYLSTSFDDLSPSSHPVRLMTYRTMHEKDFLEVTGQQNTAVNQIIEYRLNNRGIKAYINAFEEN